MLGNEEILLQNPWWTEPEWEAGDPHLKRLRQHPRELPPPDFVHGLDLATPAIHVVRGPRQVGKSTSLKLLVRRTLQLGLSPRSVVYVNLDLLQDQPIAEVARAVSRAKQLSRSKDRQLLLLDEVTAVARWQTAVKSLWDHGLIDSDTVVCTGSSAIDLATGVADRLPGRRGAGRDVLVLPQAFAAFARAIEPTIPPSPKLRLADLFTPAGREAIEEARLYGPRLQTALELYLRFGGLPAAVAEAAGGALEATQETKRVLYDSLLREVYKKAASEAALHALLERLARSLGSKTNWSHLAAEMMVPLGRRRTAVARGADYRTVRDYLEFLAAGYFVLIAYFWRADADSNELSKDKKLYFGDLLLHSVALDRAPGLARRVPALVENAFALALFRRYEPADQQFDGFLAPRRLHIWATARGGEIDFVCGPRASAEVLEVKYQTRVDRRSAFAASRIVPGRPAVVASREELEFREEYALVPAALLLWALS